MLAFTNQRLWEIQIKINEIHLDEIGKTQMFVLIMVTVFFVWLLYLTWKIRKKMK